MCVIIRNWHICEIASLRDAIIGLIVNPRLHFVCLGLLRLCLSEALLWQLRIIILLLFDWILNPDVINTHHSFFYVGTDTGYVLQC